MKQLVHKLKNGWMGVVDVPAPVLGDGMVLIRTHYSLLSPGTEAGTVLSGRKSLIGKAKERPEQVRQVIETLKQQGPLQTHRAVMKRLGAYSPLGYSIAGRVVAVGARAQDFEVGGFVAAAGAGYANHAELNAVPSNLCVRLGGDADLKQAAYNTLGAIALQGLRQADLRLGETCVVIGLGILGQLSALMLRASGVKVIGLDVRSWPVEFAAKHGIDHALLADAPGLLEAVQSITNGIGADAVIITAASASLAPINLAGRLLRKRGVVVVVGAVPTGFNREPDYYKKELSLKMSCSYGPGRYDPFYEERGNDYPAAYVRWTEKRNMAAFQEMIYTARVQVSHLTTHRYPLEQAQQAYDLVLSKREEYLGILLEYRQDEIEDFAERKVIDSPAVPASASCIRISFIGAGSYAASHLLPYIQTDARTQLACVLTATGASSRTMTERFGFAIATSDEADVFEGASTTTVFIATRHDSHGRLVVKGLECGKHVFVEKPLCLTEEELSLVAQKYRERIEGSGSALIMVGFNRRFAPLAVKLKEHLGPGPLNVLYRVNAGAVLGDSWIQDPDVGGGRIIGEVCHFVDFLTFLTGSLPVRAYAAAVRGAGNANDTLSITLSFADGSLGTIGYYANGSRSIPKEYIEVYSCGSTLILRDFTVLEAYGAKKRTFRLLNQDKGQKAMVQAFLAAAKGGGKPPIPFSQLYAATRTTFALIQSMKVGGAVDLRAGEPPGS